MRPAGIGRDHDAVADVDVTTPGQAAEADGIAVVGHLELGEEGDIR